MKLRDSWHQHMPQSTKTVHVVQQLYPLPTLLAPKGLGVAGQPAAVKTKLWVTLREGIASSPHQQSHSDRSDVNGHKREEKAATPSSKNGFKNQRNSQEVITTFKSLMHSLRNNVSKTAKQMQFFVFKLCKQ